MIVAELMTQAPSTVAPRDTLEQAKAKMEAGRFRQLPVVNKDGLVGMVTDRDMRQHGGQLSHTRVDAVMTTQVYSVRPSTPVEEAAELLIANKIGSLPVIEDDGRLVGIITATDMLRALTAVLGTTSDGSARIDLDVRGSGEISAATSLVQTICSLRGVGSYRRGDAEGKILYVRVPSTSAQRAARTLKEYGFRVIAVHA
jgi:acetoin utilization protein AcuB